MALQFTITTARGRSVEVAIYSTRAQLRRAATRWNGSPNPPDTQAVTQAFVGPVNPQVVIRLSEEHLTRRAIDHELVHAAQAIYGQDFGDFIQEHPLEHWTHHNEVFAYLFTELHELMYTALREYGLGVTDGF